MEYSTRWQTIGDPIGSGGQGKVYKAFDTKKYKLGVSGGSVLVSAFKGMASVSQTGQQYKRYGEILRQFISDAVAIEDPDNLGALKILHLPEHARDADRAEQRIANEVRAMQKNVHPNIIKLLDVDSDSKWYVSQYYSGGTLDQGISNFEGNPAAALRALRPLVEAVANLHEMGLVHRDIKPHNIFVDREGNLILGDFGLVYYTDDMKQRLSATLENVGTRDWMPAWAQGMRVEDVRASFDVFSLGKVLWAMVAGKLFMRLWYFDDPEFNIENVYPDDPDMKQINGLLAKCVVEREHACLPDARALLDEINKLLKTVGTRSLRIVDGTIKGACLVCGEGVYGHKGGDTAVQLGLRDNHNVSINICDNCGHVLYFENSRYWKQAKGKEEKPTNSKTSTSQETPATLFPGIWLNEYSKGDIVSKEEFEIREGNKYYVGGRYVFDIVAFTVDRESGTVTFQKKGVGTDKRVKLVRLSIVSATEFRGDDDGYDTVLTKK